MPWWKKEFKEANWQRGAPSLNEGPEIKPPGSPPGSAFDHYGE